MYNNKFDSSLHIKELVNSFFNSFIVRPLNALKGIILLSFVKKKLLIIFKFKMFFGSFLSYKFLLTFVLLTIEINFKILLKKHDQVNQPSYK